jgi:hypothetical protein
MWSNKMLLFSADCYMHLCVNARSIHISEHTHTSVRQNTLHQRSLATINILVYIPQYIHMHIYTYHGKDKKDIKHDNQYIDMHVTRIFIRTHIHNMTANLDKRRSWNEDFDILREKICTLLTHSSHFTILTL